MSLSPIRISKTSTLFSATSSVRWQVLSEDLPTITPITHRCQGSLFNIIYRRLLRVLQCHFDDQHARGGVKQGLLR